MLRSVAPRLRQAHCCLLALFHKIAYWFFFWDALIIASLNCGVAFCRGDFPSASGAFISAPLPISIKAIDFDFSPLAIAMSRGVPPQYMSYMDICTMFKK